jgi:chromosome segregation ATPase
MAKKKKTPTAQQAPAAAAEPPVEATPVAPATAHTVEGVPIDRLLEQHAEDLALSEADSTFRMIQAAQAESDCAELRAELEFVEECLEDADRDMVALSGDYLAQRDAVDGLQADIDELVEVKNEQTAALLDLRAAHEALTEEAEEQYEELIERDERQRQTEAHLDELVDEFDQEVEDRDLDYVEILRLDAANRAASAKYAGLAAEHEQLSKAFDDQAAAWRSEAEANVALQAEVDCLKEQLRQAHEKLARLEAAKERTPSTTPKKAAADRGTTDKENGLVARAKQFFTVKAAPTASPKPSPLGARRNVVA